MPDWDAGALPPTSATYEETFRLPEPCLLSRYVVAARAGRDTQSVWYEQQFSPEIGARQSGNPVETSIFWLARLLLHFGCVCLVGERHKVCASPSHLSRLLRKESAVFFFLGFCVVFVAFRGALGRPKVRE